MTTTSAIDSSIGIMDPAYFVGRAEILDWLNSTLKLRIAKVEDTCTGAVAAQIVDSLFPGVVMMNKLNWGAKSDYEYVANYKVLQAAFSQLKIDRKVDVTKLVQGKVQDNLEFMQWLKKFAANNQSDIPYDPVARRSLGKNVPVVRGAGKSFAAATAGGKKVSKTKEENKPSVIPTVVLPTSSTTVEKHKENALNLDSSNMSNNNIMALKQENATLISRIKAMELHDKNVENELREQLETVTKEREFYFAKLRDIELLLENVTSESNLVESLTSVLYAVDEVEEDVGIQEEEEEGHYVDAD